jgi:CHASE3 domain sensor protein
MNKKSVILFGLGVLALFMGTYVYFFIEKNNTTEFSTENAEYQELLRQYLVLKGLQDNAFNRLKFGIMKKEELEKALGY